MSEQTRTVTGRQMVGLMEQLRHFKTTGRDGYAALRAASPDDWARAASFAADHDRPVVVVTRDRGDLDGVLLTATVLGLWLDISDQPDRPADAIHIGLGEVLGVSPVGPKVERRTVQGGGRADG
jgi:hypothetical protein